MPGESIGDAYVRVHASGDNIGDSIREDVDSAGRDMSRQGEEHGGLYRRGWAKELDLFRDDLHRSLDDNLTDFSRGLDRNRVALTGADSRVEQLRRSLQGMIEDQDRARFSMEQFGHRLRIEMSGMDNDTRDLGSRIRDLTRNTNQWRDSTEEERDRLEFMRGTINAVSGSVRLLGRHLGEVAQARAFRNTLNRMGDDADRNNRLFGRMTNTIHGFSDVVGAGFGRGSRNNFINFIGSLARGMVRLVAIVPKALDALITFSVEVGKKMGKAFTDAGGGVEGLIASLVALTEQLIALGPIGLAVTIGGFVLLLATIGPLISVLSLLLGVVSALAASITFGLIGAIAPLVGLLAPLALGAGVAFLAFKGLQDQSDKLKKAIGPLTDAFGKLKDVAADNLIGPITDSLKGLGPVVKGLEPLVAGVSRALGDMIQGFADSVKGPGFASFIDNMSRFVPEVMRSLGEIMNNTFAGLGGLFISLEPITRQFLGWLTDLTARFSDFANSTEGRNKLRDFFDDVWASAQSLGNVIRSVTGFLGEFFRSGEKQGDGLLDSLSKNVDKFREWMRTADGKRSLKGWFDDAEEFGKALGRAATKGAKLFDSLDTPANRHAITNIVKGIGTIVEAMADMARAGNRFFPSVGRAAAGMWNNLMAPAFRFIIGAIANIIGVWADMLKALGHVPGFGWAKTAGAMMQSAADKADEMAASIQNIKSRSVTVTAHYITTHTTIYESNLDHAHRNPPPGGSGAPPPSAGGVTAPSASLSSGKTINNTFNVTSPNDAATVATELLNQMVASAY